MINGFLGQNYNIPQFLRSKFMLGLAKLRFMVREQKVSLLSLHFNPHLIPYISVSSIPTTYQNMLGDRDIRNIV